MLGRKFLKISGIQVGLDTVFRFLKRIGFKCLKTGAVPKKANLEVQKKFLDEKLMPRLEESKNGKRKVFFVDAAHLLWVALSSVKCDK